MKYTSKMKGLGLMMITPFAGLAQETAGSAGSSYFSNALFNTLFVIILMLLVLVIALSNSIRNIIQSDYFKERYKKIRETEGKGKALGALIAMALTANSLQAQTSAATIADSKIGGIDPFTFYFLVGIIIVEVIVVILLFNILRTYTREELSVVLNPVEKPETVKNERTILDVFNASVDIEKEAEIMLDHDYDGIKELDNNLPPWWKYGFYFTILTAFVYLINYHIVGTGDLQTAEYNKEIAAPKQQVEEYMRTSANNVDETSVKLLTESSALEAGKQIFTTNCVACHGKSGEGNTVGPNLTDEYWIHSGGIADIFKTIKYGWPDKGMKSWKDDFSPMQIAQVASFIKSLKGSNPPNPKAPQGDLYVESTSVKTDSTQTAKPASPLDSLAKKP